MSSITDMVSADDAVAMALAVAVAVAVAVVVVVVVVVDAAVEFILLLSFYPLHSPSLLKHTHTHILAHVEIIH